MGAATALANGSMGSAAKTITLRCRCPRLHRPAAEALAEAGAFAGFDLAELARERTRHPNKL